MCIRDRSPAAHNAFSRPERHSQPPGCLLYTSRRRNRGTAGHPESMSRRHCAGLSVLQTDSRRGLRNKILAASSIIKGKTPGISQAPSLIHAPLLKRLPCVRCRAFFTMSSAKAQRCRCASVLLPCQILLGILKIQRSPLSIIRT